MKKMSACSLVFLLMIIPEHVSAINRNDSVPADSGRLVMVFAGDIMGHDSQINGAFNAVTGSYDYEPSFRYVSDYLSDADIAVGNLEVTLAGPPFTGYPQFSSPDALAEEIRRAGFDVLITANNHALDRGAKGFLRTIGLLDSLEFCRAGTYRDSLERDCMHPLILEKNGIRVALLNYTYGTNGLNVSPPLVINRIDTSYIRYELEKARAAKVDYTIVCMHWGNEYERFENKSQQKLARYLLDKGADAVIGSHPHVVQPMKFFPAGDDSLVSHPVVFSLGNFISNQRDQYRDGGIIAELHLSKTDGQIRLDSLNYLPCYVWREAKKQGGSTFYILPVSRYEQAPDLYSLLPADSIKLERFAADTRLHLTGSRESGYYKK